VRKLLVLVVLAYVGYYGFVEYTARRARARQARLAAVELTPGMTMGALRASLGPPSRFEDRYEWDDGAVLAFTNKDTDDAVPYLITADAHFPGRIQNVRAGEPCGVVTGGQEGHSSNVRELSTAAAPDRVWFLVWEESGDHRLQKLALARMVKQETVTGFCPRGLPEISGTMKYDAD